MISNFLITIDVVPTVVKKLDYETNFEVGHRGRGLFGSLCITVRPLATEDVLGVRRNDLARLRRGCPAIADGELKPSWRTLQEKIFTTALLCFGEVVSRAFAIWRSSLSVFLGRCRLRGAKGRPFFRRGRSGKDSWHSVGSGIFTVHSSARRLFTNGGRGGLGGCRPSHRSSPHETRFGLQRVIATSPVLTDLRGGCSGRSRIRGF